jgi:hypothetical protein
MEGNNISNPTGDGCSSSVAEGKCDSIKCSPKTTREGNDL